MKLFDSHAHLDDEKFNEDRDEIISSFKKNNISNVITVGYNIESSTKSVELSKKYEFIYSIIGISPNDIPQNEEEMCINIEKIKSIVEKNNKIVAIGEIGLDYYWNKENKELQKKAFIKQINIANDMNLPISIHCRDAIEDVIGILKKNEVNNKGVFHCCPLNRELIKEALKIGFYISFAGPITFKNSKNADEIIKMVPEDRILIETDSPYLSPEPMRGKRNTPNNVIYIAEKIAKIKNITIEELSEIVYKNTIRIFNIKK